MRFNAKHPEIRARMKVWACNGAVPRSHTTWRQDFIFTHGRKPEDSEWKPVYGRLFDALPEIKRKQRQRQNRPEYKARMKLLHHYAYEYNYRGRRDKVKKHTADPRMKSYRKLWRKLNPEKNRAAQERYLSRPGMRAKKSAKSLAKYREKGSYLSRPHVYKTRPVELAMTLAKAFKD